MSPIPSMIILRISLITITNHLYVFKYTRAGLETSFDQQLEPIKDQNPGKTKEGVIRMTKRTHVSRVELITTI